MTSTTTVDFVYVTRRGACWHRRPDCTALVDGQGKARASGKQTHQPRRIARLIAEQQGREQCLVCQVTAKAPTANAGTDTPYEAVFLDRVLTPLVGTSGASWIIETQVTLTMGDTTCRMDFTLRHRSLATKIAIEIDGARKTPSGNDHDSFSRRQNELVLRGWQVLRFTNRQVMNDAEECRRQLQAMLDRVTPIAAPPVAVVPRKRGAGAPPRKPVAVVAICALIVVVAAVRFFAQDGERPVKDRRGWTTCPASAPIKGNRTGDRRVYHLPTGDWYERTKPEACFASEGAARAAGYRPARASPAGASSIRDVPLNECDQF